MLKAPLSYRLVRAVPFRRLVRSPPIVPVLLHPAVMPRVVAVLRACVLAERLDVVPVLVEVLEELVLASYSVEGNVLCCGISIMGMSDILSTRNIERLVHVRPLMVRLMPISEEWMANPFMSIGKRRFGLFACCHRTRSPSLYIGPSPVYWRISSLQVFCHSEGKRDLHQLFHV